MKKHISILDGIGNTPITHIQIDNNFGFYAKLEGMNPFGSMKDRAAYYVLINKTRDGTISKETKIIESSSGNFGIALSAICQILGYKIICVIDPNIIEINKRIMELYGAELKLIEDTDKNGTYQKARIDYVQKYIKEHTNVYWTNQYNNELIVQSYFSLAKEIITQVPNVTHLYVPVSTCGTIAGLSTYLKGINNEIKIIAVDVEGSKIFNKNSMAHCYFPGMGSGVVPENLSRARIDSTVIVSDNDCIENCRYLIKHGVLCGASSGGVVAAIRKNILNHSADDVIVGVFPDRGERYINNLYNENWCQEKIILSYPTFNNNKRR